PPASAQRLSWSSVKFRPLAALAFAAFVPALALCVLQYRSLVELETKTAATARERLHEVLVTSAHQFETNVHDIAAAAVSRIGAPEPPPGAELVRSFGESRRAQPAILEAFLVSQCACAGDPFVVLSSASETLEHAPLHHDRMHRFLRAYNAARVAGGFKYYVDAGDHARLYVFRTLDAQHVVFAGLTLDAAPLLQQSMQRSTAEPFAFSRGDPEGPRVWESAAHAPAPESDVRFGPMAAEWTLQARHTGATIETLAHRQFQRGLGLMALVVI